MGHIYHHPGDRRCSLDFVHADPVVVRSETVGYDDDVAANVRLCTLEREFYTVYTSQGRAGTVANTDFDVRDSLADMDDDTGTIVARLLEIYEALISQNETEEGDPVTAYRNIDIEALPDDLDRTSWEGSVIEVAGRLASNLILTHSLPNANHRTAVALVQFRYRREVHSVIVSRQVAESSI